ncbi:MAG: hypothetical protein ACKO7R_07675 [Pseudanabaena sp.]
MPKNKFIKMFKLPSLELITRFNSLCLSLVLMLSVLLANPTQSQAATAKSNFDVSFLSIASTENGAVFSGLVADAVVEPEATAETPEAKAAAKLEAKKLKEAAELEAAEAKAAEKAAKKAAKLEAKKAKEAAKLEAKKAKEAEKAAAEEAAEEKLKETSEETVPEASTESPVESEPTVSP